MDLIEDDAVINPAISESQLSYIRCLTDTHRQYTRFFDALLVPRPSHVAFFRDLKGFRCLPTTIDTLGKLCEFEDDAVGVETSSKDQRKLIYRNITQKFLGSRFAHPWCRKAAGAGKYAPARKMGGWWSAEWAATGQKITKENQEQEDKLHKLLLPLWVSFWRQMFPGKTIVEEWWQVKQQQQQQQQQQEEDQLREQQQQNPNHESNPAMLISATTEIAEKTIPVPGTKQPKTELKTIKSDYSLRHDSDDYDDNFCKYDNEDEYGDALGKSQQNNESAAAATGLLRLAAAGIIISSMPKMQQWKLKRELKKKR